MNMQDITYSIIIPNRNQDFVLQRALASIPQRSDVEIIIVDDNSSPGIIDINKYPGIERSDCHVVFTKEGKGAGYARNVGIGKAKGKWFLFLDSDDFFMEGFLDILDKYTNGTVDIVYFNVTCVDSSTLEKSSSLDWKLKALARYSNRLKLLEEYCRYHYLEPWGKLFRRDFILAHQIRFDETYCANDVLFSVKSGHFASSIVFDPFEMYCHTIRVGSLGLQLFDEPQKIMARLDVAWRLQQFYDEKGIHLIPFIDLFDRCAKSGEKTRQKARAFAKEHHIPWVRLFNDHLRLALRKRLRIGVPYCR